MASSSPNKRREMDLYKLMMTDFKVELEGDSVSAFRVHFKGPKDSPYEDGVWLVRVELPDGYPYKSPSIGFVNKIYHPNIDEGAGSVCLDVINQTWSPMFDLVNIFEVFLPQLLLYPNAADPLNGEAAALHMRDLAAYEKRVREHVARNASPEVTSRHWNPPNESAEDSKKGGGRNGQGKEDGDDADDASDDDFLPDSDEDDDGMEL